MVLEVSKYAVITPCGRHTIRCDPHIFVWVPPPERGQNLDWIIAKRTWQKWWDFTPMIILLYDSILSNSSKRLHSWLWRSKMDIEKGPERTFWQETESPVGTQISPELTALENTGTSFLQPQFWQPEFCQQPQGLKENSNFSTKRSLISTFTAASWDFRARDLPKLRLYHWPVGMVR